MHLYQVDDGRARWVEASNAWLEELVPRAQSQGQHYSVDRIRLTVGGKIILHTHKTEEQVYYILKGHGRIRIGDEFAELGPGMVVVISVGVENEMWNVSQEELEYLTFTHWPDS